MISPKSNNHEEKVSKSHPVLGGGFFNVPKKENEGEDAPPIFIVDSNSNWGVVGVFDGMGGAGAKKYKHIETGEEHTSAYWGSIIVRNCVEELVNSLKKEENPVPEFEDKLHLAVKKKLDEKIKEFPNANGSVLSKMTRKLPTTMALSLYCIQDEKVNIYTYWAGDSRVYVLEKNMIRMLTIDDSDVEDGDPFSPLNMDLAMNNAISQDRDFKINKSHLELPLSSESPFLLIAATDGCFGYYKNPIEFEAMLRKRIGKSNSQEEYVDNIKKDIIENIQQDDFSISIVGLGSKVFGDYKRCISFGSNNNLVSEYNKWRKSVQKKYSYQIGKITDLQTRLEKEKNKLEEMHATEEQKNMWWYAKYKESFSVVRREDITTI